MVIDYSTFKERCSFLGDRIASACASCGRDSASVKVLAVTKTHPTKAALYAYEYGLWGAGENRIQEAIPKIEACTKPLRWELIGHLQRNKAKLAVRHFDRIQSVDSESLLSKIDTCAQAEGKRIPILLQVNAGKDPAKYGISVEATPRLLEKALELEHVHVDGLMTIAPLSGSENVAEHTFERLRLLQENLERQFSCQLSELSMGMSGDFEQAIRAGSTCIRVGSMLYGQRS